MDGRRRAGGVQDSGLSDRDRAVLDFEREWTAGSGDKEDAIRARFGLSVARYYQVLGALLSAPAALAYDPMLVRRLQRLRDSRASARASRRLGRID